MTTYTDHRGYQVAVETVPETSIEIPPENAFMSPSKTVPLRRRSRDVRRAERLQEIVILGAGYGGIKAALRLEKLLRRRTGFRVHLIDKNPFHTLKAQLHEAAVRRTPVIIPIRNIIAGRNIIFHLGAVSKIDLRQKILQVGRKRLRFDYLVLAMGSTINYYNLPGLREYAFPLQTMEDAEKIYSHISGLCLRASVEPDKSRRRELLRFVIGGGGLAGVEFAGELADRVHSCARKYRLNPDEIEIIIVEMGDRLLPSMEKVHSETIQKQLSGKGVKIMAQTAITGQTGNTVMLSPGGELQTHTLVWSGGIRIDHLVQESGFQTGKLGRILVNPFLQIQTHPFAYAIGDNAFIKDPSDGNPVPMAAQFALQQGRLAAENIYGDITRSSKKPYRPVVWGEVVSLGKHLALGWLALPGLKKITFIGFLGRLLKTAVREKHLWLLRKESRKWQLF